MIFHTNLVVHFLLLKDLSIFSYPFPRNSILTSLITSMVANHRITHVMDRRHTILWWEFRKQLYITYVRQNPELRRFFVPGFCQERRNSGFSWKRSVLGAYELVLAEVNQLVLITSRRSFDNLKELILSVSDLKQTLDVFERLIRKRVTI